MLRAGQPLGPYRVESMLGRGAMGVVYRGADSRDGTPVAIKTLRAELLVGSEQSGILARFRQEADIGRRLRHPRIVRIRDYGEQGDIVYLAMEFVAGQELGSLLERQPDLPLGMNLAILLQLLNALAYAHGQGVIHRDIKPANILVRSDYTIALTDFGIAHVGGSDLTRIGDLLGSPLYMAPEQLRGETVDSRADLFAAGVVFYYLLTQRKPFVADSLAALMHKVLHEDPPPPSAVNRALPVAFDGVVRRALAKDRRRRFASALEFAATLRRARSAVGQTALEPTLIVPESRRPRPETASSDPSDGGELDALADRIEELLRVCTGEQATAQRLAELSEALASWFALADRVAPSSAETAGRRARLRALCAGAPLAALADSIERDAPLPGRAVRQARGDWLDLVRLFAHIHWAAVRLGAGQAADRAHADLIREFAGAFLSYAGPLNRLLFSDDSPQLARISADFMRLDVLQLALDELGAAAEVNRARHTLLLFASQVMSKVNAMIRQFLDRRDPLARYGVASLLVEVEELIVLADRLLEGSAEASMAEPAEPGGVVMIEFVGNVRELAGLIGRELAEQVRDRPPSGAGETAADPGQTLFVGRLRQLGLLYQCAAQLEAGGRAALGDLAAEVHAFLRRLTDQLLIALQALGAEEQADAPVERLWVRLTVIAELAERFGWLELRQRILIATRDRLTG